MKIDFKKLRDIASKSTKVVAWYAHVDTVRGPFARWFECQEVNPIYKKNVAKTWEDCDFAAAAMNNLVPLLDYAEKLDTLVSWAKANAPEMECRGDEDCDHCVLVSILEDLK